MENRARRFRERDEVGFREREGGAERGFHRGRSRVLAADELRLLLLSLLGSRSSHGYELIRSIGQMSGGVYAPSPGVVYPALSALVDCGHIVAIGDGGARKSFSLTGKGATEISAKASKLVGLTSRLAAMSDTGWQTHASVRRALDNLEMVLRNAALALDADRRHEIATLIDAAAQQIERL